MSDSVGGLPTAPDWTTWATSGNMLSPSGGPPAASNNIFALKRAQELLGVTNGSAPDASAPPPDMTTIDPSLASAASGPPAAPAAPPPAQPPAQPVAPVKVAPPAPPPDSMGQIDPISGTYVANPPPNAPNVLGSVYNALKNSQSPLQTSPAPQEPPAAPQAAPGASVGIPKGSAAPPAPAVLEKAKALLTPPPAAPLANPATPSLAPTGGNSEASITPAPTPQMQQIVAAAAAKYNVPENVLNWVGTHETGWHDINGPSSREGQPQGWFQIKPGTAQMLGVQDPHDFGQAADGAAKYLSQLAAANGGDWAKAVQQYGTFSTGMGADRDAAMMRGFQTAMGAKPGPTIAATTAQPEPPQSVAGGGTTNDILRQMLQGLYTPDQLRMNSSDKLLALAGGLLSGHGPADAFGRGFSALSQATQQDLQNKRAINAQLLQGAGLMGTLGYRNSELGLRQENTDIHKQSMLNANSNAQQRLAQMGERIDQYAPLAKQAVKDNSAAADEVQAAGENAMTKVLPAIQGLENNVDQSGAGPGQVNAFKRMLANNFGVTGLGVDPTASQLSDALSSQLRSGAFKGASGGVTIRNQREFQSFLDGMPQLDRNPEVLKTLMGQYKQMAQFNAQNFNDLNSMDPQTYASMMKTPGGFDRDFLSPRVTAFSQQVKPIGAFGGAPNASAPTQQQTPPISSFWK